jgi:hypothetical protein
MTLVNRDAPFTSPSRPGCSNLQDRAPGELDWKNIWWNLLVLSPSSPKQFNMMGGTPFRLQEHTGNGKQRQMPLELEPPSRRRGNRRQA